MVVVEVRQGTLRMDGSDWGPAPNNVDRRSQLDEEEEDEEEKEKEKEEEKQEDEEEERKATDIKSNNPHLAGGEKWDFRGLSWKFYGKQLGIFEFQEILWWWVVI